jgi:tRNA threonylcarbamoyl adenosine modification protein YeaZ
MLLGIDTATRRSVVAVGDGTRVIGLSARDVGHRHGSHLLEQLEEALGAAGVERDSIEAIAAGTGPGSFTGLRVGLATAKTLAYARGLRIVGISSTQALRLAARRALDRDRRGQPAPAGATREGGGDVAVVLPAGARDHYLALPEGDPTLLAPGTLVEGIPPGMAVAGVDLDADVLGAGAAALGQAALDGLADALLSLAAARLADGLPDDAATLVPGYVALPRGVAAGREMRWSPDLR